MAESEEELKSILLRVEKEREKSGLKLNIKNTKILAPGLITSWQVEGGKVEKLIDFIFLDSKITVDSDFSHEIKRRLHLGRKAIISIDGILKTRDVILPAKFYIVIAMVFPVVMYGYES